MTLPRALFAGLLALMPAGPSLSAELLERERFSLSLEGEIHYLYLVEERRLSDPDESLDESLPEANGDERFNEVSELIDNGSAFALSGEYRPHDELEAYFFAEWEFQADQPDSRLLSSESYLGLRGAFGQLQIGSWDGIYAEWLQDPLNPFEHEGATESESTTELGDLVAWSSPEFGGLRLSLQTALVGDGAGIDEDEDGRADSIYPLAAVLVYEWKTLSLRLGYDDRALIGAAAESQLALAAAWEAEPWALAAKLESVGESERDASDGFKAVGLLLNYESDQLFFSAAVQRVEPERALPELREVRNEWLLLAGYRPFEQLSFYAELARYGKYRDYDDYLGLGLKLEF